MGWLQAVETREGSIESGTGGVTVSEIFGAAPDTSAGVAVNERKARKYSAFFRGINYSAGHMGTLPVHLYQRRSDGRGRDEVTQHPASAMMKSRANPEMTSASFREALHGHLFTQGNNYAEIVRNGRQQAMELWPLNPKKTALKRDGDGTPYYATRIGGDTRRLDFGRVLHVPGMGFDGQRGWSILKLARESIGRALAEEEYSARFFGNNATPTGVLTTPDDMSLEAKKRLKRQWEAAHGGLSQQHRVAVLEAGLDWKALGISAEDAQLIESKRFSVEDMARWLGLPPHKLMENSRATFSNIESQNIEVLVDHLRPWAVRWEQALNAKVLTDNERKSGLFFKFNLDGLLRADTQARTEKQRTEVTHGLATINEIRALEERNPLDSDLADQALVRGEMMPLDMAGQLTPSERALLKASADGDTEAIHSLSELRRAELRVVTGSETRSPQGRRELVNTWRPLFARDFARLVRVESQDVRSELGLLSEGVEAFVEFLRAFYNDEIFGLLERQVADVFRQYARAVTLEAATEVEGGDPLSGADLQDFMGAVDDPTDTYLGAFSRRYAASSRRDIEAALRQAEERDEEPREAVDRQLETWNEGSDEARPRPDRKAQWEANQVGNAVAKATWAAAGVATLVWREVGDSCPICRGLDGTVVGINDAFVGEGETFVGEGGGKDITPNTNVGHPPIHEGCNCLVVPGG